MKKHLLLIGTIIASAGLILAGLIVNKPDQETAGASYQDRISSYLLGSGSTSSTLTALFTGNRAVRKSKYMENIHLDILYEPVSGQVNRYAEVLIEGSNDEGITFFPLSTKVIGTTAIALYVTSTAGYGGIPIQIPGDLISIGSTTYRGTIDFDIVADHVRVSARESGTATFGDIRILGVFSSKL